VKIRKRRHVYAIGPNSLDGKAGKRGRERMGKILIQDLGEGRCLLLIRRFQKKRGKKVFWGGGKTRKNTIRVGGAAPTLMSQALKTEWRRYTKTFGKRSEKGGGEVGENSSRKGENRGGGGDKRLKERVRKNEHLVK